MWCPFVNAMAGDAAGTRVMLKHKMGSTVLLEKTVLVFCCFLKKCTLYSAEKISKGT